MERGESKARERPIRFEEMSAFLYSSCMISFPTRNKENSFRPRLVVCRRRDASSFEALRYLPLSNLSPTWISPRCSVNIVFSRSDDPADVRAPLILSHDLSRSRCTVCARSVQPSTSCWTNPAELSRLLSCSRVFAFLLASKYSAPSAILRGRKMGKCLTYDSPDREDRLIRLLVADRRKNAADAGCLQGLWRPILRETLRGLLLRRLFVFLQAVGASRRSIHLHRFARFLLFSYRTKFQLITKTGSRDSAPYFFSRNRSVLRRQSETQLVSVLPPEQVLYRWHEHGR